MLCYDDIYIFYYNVCTLVIFWQKYQNKTILNNVMSDIDINF